LLAKAVYQSYIGGLIHRFREQARSYIGSMLDLAFVCPTLFP